MFVTIGDISQFLDEQRYSKCAARRVMEEANKVAENGQLRIDQLGKVFGEGSVEQSLFIRKFALRSYTRAA